MKREREREREGGRERHTHTQHTILTRLGGLGESPGSGDGVANIVDNAELAGEDCKIVLKVVRAGVITLGELSDRLSVPVKRVNI